MKKSYIFTKYIKKGRYYNNVTVNIYKIDQNIPSFICEHKFNTGSCKGYASEVFTALFNAGEITEGQYNRDNGYYNDREENDVRIFSI
ncbi:hypothetical protein [Dysgonomonas capnocytophagoides]|uniref:hypothetical protein n=1 Tax=Dysgonomonas capnocytophagoides TaxID=45254 RepID=UPI002924C85D|nr:hypothetical protein DCPSUM001_33750 [Dysgonomonas capnocytophagoides]